MTAAPAHAADDAIDGSPLNIYANDNGQLQVAFDGSDTGEFYPPALAPANAGLNVAVAQHIDPPAVRGLRFRERHAVHARTRRPGRHAATGAPATR